MSCDNRYPNRQIQINNTSLNIPVSTNEFLSGLHTRNNNNNNDISTIDMNNYPFLLNINKPHMNNIEIYYESFVQGGLPTRYNKQCYN
tara:strand:+ start:13653 stop:13916 length:264 start_codon:yes stop_codon:yes gene_type:complete